MVAYTLVALQVEADPAMLLQQSQLAGIKALKDGTEALKDGQATIYEEQRGQAVRLGHVAELLEARRDTADRMKEWPPAARPDLLIAIELEHPAIDRILTAVAASDDPGRAIEEIVATAPPWFANTSAHTRRALALACDTWGRPQLASELYEQTALLGLEPARHLALAAFRAAATEDTSRAEDLIARALGVRNTDRTARLVRAAIDNDHEAILAAAADDTVNDVLLLPLVAMARERSGDMDGAAVLYRQGIERFPDRAGLHHLLAALLLRRAQLGRAINKGADTREARQLAIKARDMYRSWHGPSETAVLEAALAAVHDGDPAGVLRLVLPPPDGEAWPKEANHPEALHLGVEAAVTLGRTQLAAQLAESVTDPFKRTVLSAGMLQHAGDLERARTRFEDSWPFAASDQDRRAVQIGLATLGVWPVPGLDEVADSDPIQADLLHAVADMNGGNTSAARARLRQLRTRSETAAGILARLLAREGDIVGAAATLTAAAHRFDSPRHLIDAADLLCRAGNYEDARSRAEEALALAAETPTVRREARQVLAEIADHNQDWAELESLLRALLADEGDTAERRWHLVYSLCNQRRLEQAWTALQSPPALEPHNENQAVTWVQLHQRFQPSTSLAQRLLELVETYGSSEQFMGAALGASFSMGQQIESLGPEGVAHWQAVVQDFLARFPHSTIFRALPVGTTPEETVEALRPVLEPGAARFAELQRLASIPTIPYGVLAVQAGRPYAIALLHRAAGCFPTRLADAAVNRAEREAARQALDHRIVTEASTLHLMNHLPDLWPITLSMFSTIDFADASRHDLQAAVEALSGLPTSHMTWDVLASRPVLSETSMETARDLLRRAQWMLMTATDLDEFRAGPVAGFDPAIEERVRPWLAAVHHAREHGLALYSDDAALRHIARSQGVPAFGTVALLDVLVADGHLNTTDAARCLYELRTQLYVDLPADLTTLSTLGAAAEWRWGPATLILARPAFWTETPQPLSVFHDLCRHAEAAAEGTAPIWVYAAVRGACAQRPPDDVTRIASAIIVAANNATMLSSSGFANVVAAARRGSAELGGGDPLLPTTKQIFDDVSTTWGTTAGTSVVVQLVSDLVEPDRQMVTNQLLGVL